MGKTTVEPSPPTFLPGLKTSSAPIQQKAYKQHSKPHKKMCTLVKMWQPSVSGMATLTTGGQEVPMPVLTASGKKLALPLPFAGEGSEGGKSLVNKSLVFLVTLQLRPLQRSSGLG